MKILEIHGFLMSKASRKDVEQKTRELRYLMSRLKTDKGKQKLKNWHDANKDICQDIKVSGLFPEPISLSLFVEAMLKS